jgi:hypothetical protein
MEMRTICAWKVAAAVVVLSGCVSTGDGSKWTCSAEGLVNSNFTGGDFAMIQLQGFASGGSYKVGRIQAPSATGLMILDQ